MRDMILSCRKTEDKNIFLEKKRQELTICAITLNMRLTLW